MDQLIRFFTFQWQRKLVALLIAFMLWFLVDKSITETKTIPNVPIRVINLPNDKTIAGLLPNGILSKRINLTLSGTKKVIDNLESSDLQILVDAAYINQDEWYLQITRQNLVSLNPSIDLAHHITNVQHPDFIIKLSRIGTARIPIGVRTTGSPPPGYEYLDIWPQNLKQTIVGPEEEVQKLANNGIELLIDMNLISSSDLDKIKSSRENYHDDEVSFFIPSHWKKIGLSFRGNSTEEINDPEAQNLHIDFLRKEFLPIERDIAVTVFLSLRIFRPHQSRHTPSDPTRTTQGKKCRGLPCTTTLRQRRQ